MKYIFQILFLTFFLSCEGQVQVNKALEYELSSIKDDLIENGKNSQYYKSDFTFECYVLDSTFAGLLREIEPNFLDSLNLDKDNYQENYSQFILENRLIYKTSSGNLKELFNDVDYFNEFLKILLETDYNEMVTLNSVIYDGDEAVFSISGDFWHEINWIRLKNNKIETAILLSIIE